MEKIGFWINLVSNSLTIIASTIAIYLFTFRRGKVISAINFILNYSHQLTLADLKYKIERLNDYSVNDILQKDEVINILFEIEGQINGSEILKIKLSVQLKKILNFTNNIKLLSEPKKRSLVSELRESLRHLDISNYNNLISNNILNGNENN
jgi:hypothetical protein